MKDSIQVVLIFGTFNPVTNAHINMGVLAKNKYPKAKIIYVPASTHYLSESKKLCDRNIMSNKMRYDLLKEAVSVFGFKVSPYEFISWVSGFTIDTVNFYKTFCDEVIICIGADNVNSIHKWKDGQKLVEENQFLIITRDGIKGEIDNSISQYADHFHYEYNDCIGCSSTKVREAYKNKDFETIKQFAPTNVYEYLMNTEDVYV